jgi:anti-anti-sigma factor
LYGVERLSSLLQKNTTHSASDLVNIIHSDVTLFAGNKPFLDGFSLILFKVEADIVAHANTKEHICKFDSDLSQLKFVRSFINSFCVQLTENHKPLSEPLSLATNEVFCNIIKHGYKNQPGNQVIIQAEAKESEITIEILDQGVSFDPTEIQHPSFSGDKDGGFGFFLIKSIADQLSYSKKKSEEGWNCLRITKKYNFYEDEMEFSNYNDEDILVVKLEKESLDAKEAPEFKKRITSLIDQEGAQKVIFDLSKLTFIDSTGLGCFLSILRSLNGSQGDLKLANMTRSIHAIFEIVCMNKIFEIYNSVEEALEAYQSGKVST